MIGVKKVILESITLDYIVMDKDETDPMKY